tara:strand:+ start:61 stop:414 length:354 start_codon:yes stop_codon:yes gene_type:complete
MIQDIILELTQAGNKMLLEWRGIPVDNDPGAGLFDLLNALEAEYFIMPSKVSHGIDEWYIAYSKEYLRSTGADTPTDKSTFMGAILCNLVGLRIVVWDNKDEKKVRDEKIVHEEVSE